jgi:hypothetical protein
MSSAFIPGVAECIELLGGRCDVAGNCKAIPVDGRESRPKREGFSGQGATDYDSGFRRMARR